MSHDEGIQTRIEQLRAQPGSADVDCIDTVTEVDDLSREVYCVLGIAVDAIEMSAVLRRIDAAIASREPFFLSTPNLNFLITSQQNREFRNSLLCSDLCPADGMPVVWIARLLGAPIKARVAGSDIFEMLTTERASNHCLSFFLFGGPEGVAADACRKLNAQRGAVTCAGSLYPGYGTIDEMSSDDIVQAINASGADFLVVALGAQKGQAWLRRNHERLRIPIRAHLGAAIAFQAGKLKRAPTRMQKWGLEWLWRIKEEPHLWRRYWIDGTTLLQLLLTRVLPLAIILRWHRPSESMERLLIDQAQDQETFTIRLSGAATARDIDTGIRSFRDALREKKPICVDLSGLCLIDARFMGLLLMLRKQLEGQGLQLNFTTVPRRIERLFRLNGFEYLLSSPN